MNKPISRIIIEAIFVGLLFIPLFMLVQYALLQFKQQNMLLTLFLTAALFHIVCEYTGLNLWYVQDYNKFIRRV
jgi:hypothetical protein